MLFTVDLEDWFCNPNHTLLEWKRHSIRMEAPTHRLLDMMDEHGAKGTFFILGWIAERRPQLIKEIHRRGHEIASHGYSHRLVYEQKPKDFQLDIHKSKQLLEQLTGTIVRGYRAPCFSMTEWGLDLLIEEGYTYDSSLMPNSLLPQHDKLSTGENSFPFKIRNDLWEFPIPTLKIGNWSIPCGGGGYFRLYPYPWFRHRVRTVRRRGEAFLFYIHPYDIDSGQPRSSEGNWIDRFRRGYGLSESENKLGRLLSDNSWISIHQFKQRTGRLSV